MKTFSLKIPTLFYKYSFKNPSTVNISGVTIAWKNGTMDHMAIYGEIGKNISRDSHRRY